MNEETFRGLLDKDGVLRDGALKAPPRTAAFSVFAQAPHPMLDVGALKNQAQRFFASKLGLTVEKRYGHTFPAADAARVVLASNDASGTRLVYGRRTTPEDLAIAEEAERAMGTSGMSLLAQRCPTLWMVTFESEDDRVALTLAAIFASVLLGPIVSPAGNEIFGVRTARLKLESRTSPYR